MATSKCGGRASAASPARCTWPPAFTPMTGLELGAVLARDRNERHTLQGVQAKWLWSPAQEQGCNAGSSAGVVRASAKVSTPVSCSDSSIRPSSAVWLILAEPPFGRGCRWNSRLSLRGESSYRSVSATASCVQGSLSELLEQKPVR